MARSFGTQRAPSAIRYVARELTRRAQTVSPPARALPTDEVSRLLKHVEHHLVALDAARERLRPPAERAAAGRRRSNVAR